MVKKKTTNYYSNLVKNMKKNVGRNIDEAETDERYLRKIDAAWEKGKITDIQHTKLEKLMFKKSRLFRK
mgnify:FL=1|jgi:hypothetical protein|tara:strand:- start:285 stop:491 length:207 start_codon:yes stop_codon:yes gene_type:complete